MRAGRRFRLGAPLELSEEDVLVDEVLEDELFEEDDFEEDVFEEDVFEEREERFRGESSDFFPAMRGVQVGVERTGPLEDAQTVYTGGR